jgi:hypothetical protein
MFDPVHDVDPGNRAFYMRLGLIMAVGVVAIAALLLAGPR